MKVTDEAKFIMEAPLRQQSGRLVIHDSIAKTVGLDAAYALAVIVKKFESLHGVKIEDLSPSEREDVRVIDKWVYMRIKMSEFTLLRCMDKLNAICELSDKGLIDIIEDSDPSTIFLTYVDAEADESLTEEEEEDRKRRLVEDWKIRRSNRKTNLYLMKDEANGFIKVGISNTPEYRERTLQSEKPTIVMIWATEASYQDETFLHRKFSEKRLRGEWFELSDEDIKYIKSEQWKECV